MARKNLLQSLMGPGPVTPPDTPSDGSDTAAPQDPSPAPAAPSAAPSAARPRYTKGAIGAVSQSIADLKSRAITEIDPFAIDQGGIADRFDDEDADHTALVESIRAYGQQVPVLVRPHPAADGRFQIVYGRRRVKALRDLGLPVKAMIRDLDDRELVIAQGQENSARKDLTFIEKANFARQMREAGYDRKVICDALHVDKTQVSRMLAVADALPLSLIEAIGAAPAVGRNRWLDLARLLTDSDTRVEDAIALVHLSGADLSDARFEALMRALTLPRRRAQGDDGTGAVEIILRSAAGVEVGRLTRRRGRMTLTIPLANAEGFDAWLEANFQKLHRDWLASRGDGPGEGTGR